MINKCRCIGDIFPYGIPDVQALFMKELLLILEERQKISMYFQHWITHLFLFGKQDVHSLVLVFIFNGR